MERTLSRIAAALGPQPKGIIQGWIHALDSE